METIDPLLSLPPEVVAEIDKIYEQGQKSASIRYGKKMAKLKGQTVEIALSGVLIGAMGALVLGSGVLYAFK